MTRYWATHSGESNSQHTKSPCCCSVSLWPHGPQPTRLLTHGISQARILEWVAISFFRGPSRPRDQIHVSCVSCMGRHILYHWVTREAQVTLQSAYLLIQNGLCLFPITGPFISAIQHIFSDIKPEKKLMVIRFLLYTGHASHIYTCYF